MKVRNDFVTNSSSSSFILARKPGVNDKQKEAIIQYVENHLLGEEILSPDSPEEEIQKVFQEYYEFEEDEDRQQEVRKRLEEGKSIYAGQISFEECDYSYADLFQHIWQIMEEYSDGGFEAIKDDLSY